MDPREQIGDHTEALTAMLDGRQSSIWTLLPGIVQSFDPANMTAVVAIALTATQIKADGTQDAINFPPLVDCPVVFPSGGGFILTFPIQAGDECEVRFSSRCIDAWWQNGGVQAQQTFRMHDLSDGFVTVGPRSKPNVPADITTDATELRSDDGSTYIRMNRFQVVGIVAPGGITLNGVTIDSAGNISNVGTLMATGEGTFNGHTVGNHHHTQPNDSHGDVEGPTSTPIG
jgi:hypothetical protein